MPGFPVLHYLPEFAQIHVLWVGDAIQSSHPLPSPSPTFNLDMTSNHLILCHPLLFLSSVFLHIRWPKYWSFSSSISLSNDMQSWFPLGVTGLICLLSKHLSKLWELQWRAEKPGVLRYMLSQSWTRLSDWPPTVKWSVTITQHSPMEWLRKANNTAFPEGPVSLTSPISLP